MKLRKHKRFVFCILLFANLVLLAHSFIPHHHHKEMEESEFANIIHSHSTNHSQNNVSENSCCVEKHNHNTKHSHISQISAFFGKINITSHFISNTQKGYKPVVINVKKVYCQFKVKFLSAIFISSSNLRGPPISIS